MHWRLHLGVHKTATTHLQLSLESIRSSLAQQGVDYIPLDVLRSATAKDFDHAKRFKAFKFRRAIRSVTSGLNVTILSEENWLGHPYEGCQFPPYPRASERLGVIAKLGGTFSAFLSVRNPAQFAASIYSEAMRHHPQLVSLDRTRDAWLAGGSPWFGLVETISRTFPNLKVWRYEDYSTQVAASQLAGVPVTVPPIPEPELTKRLSTESIWAIEQGRPPGTGGARFEMFSADEQLRLSDAYDADVERIRARGFLL